MMPPMATTAEPADHRRPDSVLTLLTRPNGWRRIRLFGASSNAPHVRRRADLTTLIVAIICLAVVVPTARTTDGVEAAVYEAIGNLPTLFDPLFAIVYDALAVWAVGSLLLVAARRHWRLAVAMALALPVSAVLTLAVDAALGSRAASSGLQLGAPVDGVPVQLVAALTLTTLSAREMSRPFRVAGRRLILAAAASAVLYPVAAPYRVLCAGLVALAAASAVRYLLGSPVSAVSARDARDDLADLGVVAEPDDDWAAGVRQATTTDGDRVSVHILGRDEWENQLAATLWRFLWYRSGGRRLILSPRQRIEHQAFLQLLAQTRGVPVTPLVAAGTSRTGDALIACRIEGTLLDDLESHEVDDAFVDRCWQALTALHDAGIAHAAIDARAIFRTDDGRAVLGSFEQAQALTEPTQVHADRAQLLVTTALSIGVERAVAAAIVALGAAEDDVAGPLVSFLQVAALDQALRDDVEEAGLSLEELRTTMAEAAGIEVPDLQKIWRVSWAALLRLAGLALVAYLLISQLADIGWDTIVEAITSANPWILLTALLFGQLPRVAQAASLQTASPAPVPLGRVTRLQFATSFVNLAVPSTAARVAVSIRFFQRSGATPAGAVSAGALDSFAGFIAQISLLGGFVLAGSGTLGWPGLPDGTPDRSQVVRVVLILLAIVAALVLVVMLVPSLRARAVHIGGQLKEALAVLRSPVAVVKLLAFNLLAELLFATTIWIVLQAFGQQVAFSDVIIINEAVALFAGLMPVPGGVGVTEGALTAGFTAVGVPQSIAFSAALCYRMCTFYLPPLWGYVALSSLRRDGYL